MNEKFDISSNIADGGTQWYFSIVRVDVEAADSTAAIFSAILLPARTRIGHFRVPKILTFKMRSSAQPFL